MATYLMLGKYSSEAVKGISSARTKEASALIGKLGGKIVSMHALLGAHDLAILVDLPSMDEAIKASIGLQRLTAIGFVTAPAIPVESFDKLVAAS